MASVSLEMAQVEQLQKYSLRILIGLALAWLPSPAPATIYVNLDLESSTVNAAIADGSTHDGSFIDLQSGDAAYPTPYTRNTLTTPSGVRYHEILTICGGYTAGNRCTNPGNQAFTTAQAQFGMSHTSIDWNARSGETFYLGGFFRFDMVGGRPAWDTSDSFDKLLELGANPAGTATRWGIGSGRHGNFSGWSSANVFTFDVWCADSVFDACEVGAQNDWDHKPHNTGGYTASNPYECEYGRWYAVVLAVTMSTTSSGNVKLYINGTLVHDSNRITMDTGSGSSSVQLHGTIAQGAYDAPDHYRRSDKLMLTDSLTDITNAGLMSDPEAGGGGGGSIVIFLGQSAVTIVGGLQYLACVAFLWERRAKVVHFLMLVHAAYWTARYRWAVTRWQQQAPLMLEAPRETIDLTQQGAAWRAQTRSRKES